MNFNFFKKDVPTTFTSEDYENIIKMANKYYASNSEDLDQLNTCNRILAKYPKFKNKSHILFRDLFKEGKLDKEYIKNGIEKLFSEYPMFNFCKEVYTPDYLSKIDKNNLDYEYVYSICIKPFRHEIDRYFIKILLSRDLDLHEPKTLKEQLYINNIVEKMINATESDIIINVSNLCDLSNLMDRAREIFEYFLNIDLSCIKSIPKEEEKDMSQRIREIINNALNQIELETKTKFKIDLKTWNSCFVSKFGYEDQRQNKIKVIKNCKTSDYDNIFKNYDSYEQLKEELKNYDNLVIQGNTLYKSSGSRISIYESIGIINYT